MANIDCVLDTSPMAQSIDTVSKHVAATTAAVAAMQTAVIATQKKTSDEICENVDRGFFNLIRSQVSSKKAKYFCFLFAQSKFYTISDLRSKIGCTSENYKEICIFAQFALSLQTETGW